MTTRSHAIELAGTSVMLACILVRVTSTHDSFPGWLDDPIAVPTVVSGLTPFWSIVVDIVMMAGAATVLLATVIQGRAVAWWIVLLAATGCVGAGIHSADRDGVSLDNALLGVSWCAGVWAAIAGVYTSPTSRRLLCAGLVGVVGMLFIKSVVQVFIEHGETVSNYLSNKEAIIAAKGWTIDSPMARNFERRLMQNDATGWLGLSNVIATFGVASVCVGVGMYLAMLGTATTRGNTAVTATPGANERTQRPAFLSAFTIGAALCTLTGTLVLVLAGSKGGYAACTFGLICLFVPTLIKKFAGTPGGFAWLARRTTIRLVLGRVIGIGAIVLPLVCVVIRGSIGEKIGELSLLFRWFYITTATKIFASAPLIGVGPDGFQSAYVLQKPLISPEAVRSPHSIMFDWAAALGLPGCAWCVLLIVLAWRIGGNLMRTIEIARVSPPPTNWNGAKIPMADAADGISDTNPLSSRNELRLLAGAGGVALVFAAALESPEGSMERTLVRILGCLMFAACGFAILTTGRRSPLAASAALCAAALGVLSHGQIEMTPANSGSAAWWLALVGVSAGEVPSTRAATERKGGRGHGLAVMLSTLPLVCAAGCSLLLLSISAWETRVRRSVEAANPLAVVSMGFRALAKGDLTKQEESQIRREVLETLARLGYTQANAEPELISAGFARMRDDVLVKCAAELEVARMQMPTHFGTVRSLSRVYLERGELLMQKNPESAAEILRRGQQVLIAYISSNAGERLPTAWAWYGTYCKIWSEWIKQDDAAQSAKGLRKQAAIGFEKAAHLDPANAGYSVEAAEIHFVLGDAERAASFARDALSRNENTRLDPLVGMSEIRRKRMLDIAGRR